MAVTVGLAGTGRAATEGYAPALACCPKAGFAGVWGRSPDAAGDLAVRFSVPAFGTFDELLDHCDAVAFAVPPAAQPPLAALAAGRRKAVLLTRPIAGDLAGAEELAAVVAEADVVTQVALTWRYADPVRAFLSTGVKRTDPRGGTGRLISGAFAAGALVRPWRVEGGILLDLGVDVLDLLDAVLGRTELIRAHGDPCGWVGLMLEHEGGRYSEASLYATASPDEPARAEVEIFGPGGSAVVDGTFASGKETYATMIGEFADAVEYRMPHELDVRRGLHLQRLLDAAETDLLF
ncbi:Gfo/Idh/MocA family oxidoreductase [Actinomadura sp. DC4]|uniref:Gfo/Idh/MocA family oxidoreductase n=1 Tax=Actinomadura sp. DC4 TaxID=3055069 RepID=UPI0025AFB6F2|nr:Gfo/Idh/MocA family oxidoreductase [Actinomadura sp. DC4]MDN3354339.1 Gfo/Idh/MocA family oxidoreductase [Actinomadura sp. DC4]